MTKLKSGIYISYRATIAIRGSHILFYCRGGKLLLHILVNDLLICAPPNHRFFLFRSQLGHFLYGAKAHTFGHAMVHTGRFLTLYHPAHAKIAKFGRYWDIFDDPPLVHCIGALDYANAPLVRFEIIFLFAGKFAGMTAAAPIIIDIQSVFHKRLSFWYIPLMPSSAL
jgi:hypothetical protein